MKKIVFATAVALTALAAPASAGDLAVEAMGARAHGRWGGEFGAGYAFEMSIFKLRPMLGAFLYKGDNDRYYRDDLGNGQSRCRDSTNGQFAKDSNCDNTAVKPYAKLEATISIPAFAEVGAGARFSSDKVEPYGTVAFSISPNPVGPAVKIKGNAGEGYYALGLAAGF